MTSLLYWLNQGDRAYHINSFLLGSVGVAAGVMTLIAWAGGA